MLWFFKILLTLLPLVAAEFSLTSGLTEANRKSVLEILGLGSSSKNISTLRPLGTNSGLEVAFALEFIDTSNIKEFIADDRSRHTVFYPKILIGKGIYERIDLFFHFIPYTATFGITEFGSLLRYNFLNQSIKPFVLTGLIHANSANFNNQLVSRNLGADMMFGYKLRRVSLFTTLGWASAYGKFVGGAQGVTDTLISEREEVSALHSALALTLEQDSWSVTASLDHYIEPVYTLKLSALF
jgi:hypothetical protein